jgi:hypothetical protein
MILVFMILVFMILVFLSFAYFMSIIVEVFVFLFLVTPFVFVADHQQWQLAFLVTVTCIVRPLIEHPT